MPRKIPVRTCTGCGAKKDKKDMIRIIRTPEGKILSDTTGKMQGRGAYICRDLSCLEKARKRHTLARSLHTEIPEDIYVQLRNQLAKTLKDEE